MPYLNKVNDRPYYQRPMKKRRFRTIEEMLVDSDLYNVEQVEGIVPEAGQTRGLKSAFYEETDKLNGADIVVCSGAIRLFGGYTDQDSGAYDDFGGNYIGVLMRDSAPGDFASWFTKGRIYLPIDAGDSTTGRQPATVVIRNKPAYHLVDEGLFTDIKPVNGEKFLQVGWFRGDREINPKNISWGVCHAIVEIDPQCCSQDSAPAPTQTLNCLCETEACDVKLFPEIVAYNDLVVDFVANAYSGNPYREIDEIKWNFSGATDGVSGELLTEATGERATYEFSSGSEERRVGKECRYRWSPYH